eukprot:UN00153
MLSNVARRAVIHRIPKRGFKLDAPNNVVAKAEAELERTITVPNPDPVTSLFAPSKSTVKLGEPPLSKWNKKVMDIDQHHHHHENVMPRASELPEGDWRRKPMYWNWNKIPETDYERWVVKNIPPDSKMFTELTKGEFIVHARRIWWEQIGYEMYLKRFYGMAIVMVPLVWSAYRIYTPDDPAELTFPEIQYKNIMKPSPWAQNSTEHQSHKERLADFFADHDEEDIAKLPKNLQDLYYKHKDEYNASL